MAKFLPVRLSHNVYESKDGSKAELPPIIFLSALTTVKELWFDVPQKLADLTNRKAYTYDARNQGDSEYTDDFSYDLNVKDLFHFMDTMKIQKAILVGHNMGGHTAIHAALQQPQKVEMLFVEDMFVKSLPKAAMDFSIPAIQLGNDSLKHIPKGMAREDAIKFFADYMLDNIPADSMMHKFVNKENIYQLQNLLKQNSEGEYIPNCNVDVIIKAMKLHDGLVLEAKGEYSGPTFFLYSKESPLQVHAHEEHIKQHFPNAELIGFEGQIHVLHIDRAKEFVDTIYRCLQK